MPDDAGHAGYLPRVFQLRQEHRAELACGRGLEYIKQRDEYARGLAAMMTVFDAPALQEPEVRTS